MKRLSFQRRLHALQEVLADKSPDTVWIIQPENRRYISGFRAADTQFNESSGSLLISRKKAILITDSRYTLKARREARDFEVITLNKELVEELPALLARLKTKTLGFEEDYLAYGLHRRLVKGLRGLSQSIRLTPLKRLIEKMREVKDPSEIRVMKASADRMSEVLDHVIGGLRPGQREIDIARKIERLSYEAGAEGMAFPPIVASGPNGALPHAVPTAREIRPGEPIIMDVGLKLDGYCCDMTRTVFMETPGPKFRKIYRTVRQAQLSALTKIRPGIESTLPDSVAREIIKDAGFGDYFGHSLGHGVGLATHEGPRLGPRKPMVLEKGMVVTVEPGIYIPGKGGVRLEEMVVIGKDRPEILTKNRHFYEF